MAHSFGAEDMTGARFLETDLTGAEFREAEMSRTRMIGVVMRDAVIDGLVTNLVVNDVEVMGYVEAELDRRHPVRPLLRSDDPAELRRGWAQLSATWAATETRIAALPDVERHRRVGGEWSAVETMRHLVFVADSWFRRSVLGLADPFDPAGLTASFMDDRDEAGLGDVTIPSFEQVRALREARRAELADYLGRLDDAELSRRPAPVAAGWPPGVESRTVAKCLHTVLEEEWAHHQFCVRDLDILAGVTGPRDVASADG